MTTSGRFTSVVLAVCLLAVPAHGQEPQAGLGLDAAIARALEREPALRAARTDIDVALGQRQQAGLRPNPTVTVDRRDERGGTDNQTSVGIQWPLDLFRRAGRVESAARQIDVTRFSVADRERLLAADVRMQYGAAAAAIRDVSVADELVTAARGQLDLVRARVDEGATPPIDRDLLDVDLRRLEADRLVAVGRADAALVRLKPLLGMRPDEPLALGETIESLVERAARAIEPPHGAGVAAVRPDVREADARVSLAEAAVDRARREGRFDVSVVGGYMRMDAGFAQRGFNLSGGLERVRGRFTNFSAGAMVMVPLFNRNQGQVASARAEVSGAESRRDAVTLAAQAEVAAARALDTQTRRAADLYGRVIQGLARQNLDVVRQTFDLGRATVFEVLAEQRRYLEMERDYTTTLREAWEARVALSRALGETR